MNDLIARWARTLGTATFLGMMIAAGTGCGAISAAANPKVAWAVGDPAPMSVVVRRADVAEKTAQGVDKVMTSTPTNDDSSWLVQVAPTKEAATEQLTTLRQHQLYAPGGPGQGARIVPAEVWAKSLAKAAEPPTAATPATVAAPAPATAPPPEVATPDSDPTPVAKPKKGRKPTLAKSPKPKSGKRAKKPTDDVASSSPPVPVPVPVPASPALAPAPAPALKYPSLLSAIDKDLATSWAQILEKKKAVGDLKSQIASEEAALDVKGISDADRRAHKRTIEKLELSISHQEKEVDKLAEAFIAQAKASAQRAPADVRAHFGPVLVNLRQAVDDANTANGAAAVRYPMAATSIPNSAQHMAAVYVADVIEEKTGKRPQGNGVVPAVTLEGTKVNITINGLSQADLGKTSVAEVTSEVTARTTAWVRRAVGLLGTIAATKDMLSFEDDVLSALIDGFKASGWTPPAAVTIPEAPGAAAAAPAPRAQGTPRS